MKLSDYINEQTGMCCANYPTRNALRDAVTYGTGTIYNDDGEALASVECVDDASEHEYNQENTTCAVLKITDENSDDVVFVGYYSDGAQHALDVLSEGYTVEEWAKEWDHDGVVPCYIGLYNDDAE